MLSLRQSAALVAAVVVYVALVAIALVELVLPAPPPPDVDRAEPFGAALTEHVVFVIIDGLRYDIATDDEWMPHMARRMREHTSAEMWANQITMTSSAVLTYGTGQRGDIDQIVTNETQRPARYDHLPSILHDARLSTAAVGDRGWFRMFPGTWDKEHQDPEGVAIDVDYNPEIFAAATKMLGEEPRPAFMVVHFVTPDHQAHAYTVKSAEYEAHIHAFDKTLNDLLESIPDDTTVFVTSDHGATDSGRHGSNLPVERRCPIYAYGPGIVDGLHDTRKLEQIDIPGTFAALLGASAPAHSRGHVLVRWLDVSEEERARIACADLARLERFVRAEIGDRATDVLVPARACVATSPPTARVEAARAMALALDGAISARGVEGKVGGWAAPAVAILGALLLAGWLLRRELTLSERLLLAMVVGLAIVAAALWNAQLERFPRSTHVGIYVGLTVVADLLLVFMLLKPHRVAAWADTRIALAALLVPGLIVLSYTRTTQPQAYVLTCILLALALVRGAPRAGVRGALKPREWTLGWPIVLGVALLMAALFRVGFRGENHLPELFRHFPPRMLALAMASLVVYGVIRHLRATRRGEAPEWVSTLAAIALAAACLYGRRVAPPMVCLAGWGGLGAVALWAFSTRRQLLGELLLLASWAWVSRDAEVPILIMTLLVASAFADAVERTLADDGAPGVRPSAVIFVVTFLFVWPFLQRIGVQLGLDFMHFDWGAAAFRDKDASLARIGAGLLYKHAVPRAMILALVLGALPHATRLWAARGLLVVELIRAALLTTMLYASRASFWTSMRVMGDIPHALVASLVAVAAFIAVTRGSRFRSAAA